MVNYLVPNFLTDPNQYKEAESIWHQHWKELLRRMGEEWVWKTPWLGTTLSNGTPCRDGNPIFSALSVVRRLGVRVIQLEPSDDRRELYVWTDTYAKGFPESVKELVISCVLTDQTLLDSLDLMKRWLEDEVVELSWKNEYLGRAPIAHPTSPRRLKLAVARPHLVGQSFSY